MTANAATVELQEQRIGDGRAFFVDLGGAVSLAAGATLDVSFVSGAIRPKLAQWQFNADTGPCNVFLFEAATFTAGTGTAMTPRNMRRDSSNVATVSVRSGVTTTATGLQLIYDLISTTKQSAGLPQIPSTWYLKTLTTYIMRITNTAAQPANIDLNCWWYE